MSTLENLKVGDSVILQSGWRRYGVLAKRVVSKVGKIHLSIEGCSDKFRISTGSAVGYSGMRVRPYDEAKWQEYLVRQRQLEMRGAVAAFDFRDCEMELIEKVYALLPKKAQP